MRATFATATHSGLVRPGNEDAALAQLPVFAVADGMGGAKAGEIASGMAVAALEEAQPATSDELALVAQKINRDIFEHASGDASRSGMGTTLTAALLTADRVDFVHVGDSRAYRLRGGKLEQLSADHSLVAEMVRRGDLSEEEAMEHPQRSIITRALGVDNEVELDNFSVQLDPGDLFLLCSDGLFSMVAAAGIEKILNASKDLTSAASALVEEANAGGGQDNVTVVLFCPDGTVPSGDTEAATGVTVPIPNGSGLDPEKEPRGRRWRSWKALAAILLVLIVVLISGSWYMSRQIFYLGVSDGRISIYQGLPFELGPLSLSSLYRQSDVLLDELAPFEQERVLRQELNSLETAEAILENYSGSNRSATDGGARSSTGRSQTATATATGAEP